MNQIIITRGIPASGKSTWARQWVSEKPDTRVEINMDNIRNVFGFGYDNDDYQNSVVRKMHREMINAAITSRKDIVVSDHNMRPKNFRDIIEKGITSGYDVTIKDFHINFDEAVKRDKKRENPVGEPVIRDFHKRFPPKHWINADHIVNEIKDFINHYNSMEPYVNDPTNPEAILVDVDGTIAHNDGIRDDYDYSDRVMMDAPDPSVIKAVQIAHNAGISIIIMSGRKNICRDDTISWMNNHNVPYDDIHMRADDDNRPDWIVKDELVREHIQNRYHVIWCYDDRNQVVDHHRKMGYQVFQVAPGNF